MKRPIAIALLLGALAFGVVPSIPASERPDAAPQVTLILVPNLRWEDITTTATPTLARLAAEGAIGDINARSRTRLEEGVVASPLEGALTVSAGAWASPVPGAPAAYSADEPYEGGTAAEAYRRTTGVGVGDSTIAFLGMPMTQRFNDELSFEVELGTLGQAIEEAGGSTAAIGNSDTGYAASDSQMLVRPAALAAMNRSGLVAYGDISQRVLREDPNAPYGVATDVEALSDVLASVGRRLAQRDAQALVVLDPGDTYRAVSFAPYVSDDVADGHWRRALENLDAVVTAAEERLPEGGVLIVASQVPGVGQERVEGLGPIIVSGPGWSGFVTSSSTQRQGIVTNLDITATVLDVLGIERPVNVLGNPLASAETAMSVEERVEYLATLTATAESVDSAKVAIINGFIAVLLITVIISTFVLMRARHWSGLLVRRWVWTLLRLLLLLLCVPAASYLMFLFYRWPTTAGSATAALVVTALTLWVLLLVLEHLTSRHRLALAALCLATAGTILVDQWLGAPLSFTSFFGYSPLLGARFYGLGNEAAAVLVGASMVGLALLFDEWPQSVLTARARSWGVLLAGLVVVVTAAAPGLGANVGVAVWGTIAFALAWAQMSGRRVSWRLAVGALAVMVALLAVFSLLDLGGGGSQTHLGRAWASAAAGGIGELGVIIARKAQTNLRVFTHTNWAYVLVGLLAFLGFMRWRPHGDFAATLSENPDFSAAMSALLLGGLAAFFTEDSGIVIPAIILVYVGVGMVYLMLARLGASRSVGDGALESGEDAAA